MVANVHDRLGRLERELARWRVGVLVVALLGVGVATLGHAPRLAVGAPPEVAASLKASSFEVLDEKGNLRAQLYSNPLTGGAAQFRIMGEDRTTRVRLEETATGACWLSLSGKDGILRVMATVGPNGDSSLTIHGSDGRPRAELRVGAEGESSIDLRNNDGQVIWSNLK